MRIIPVLGLLFLVNAAVAQKKPLDHSVYDGWQTISERMISDNGEYIAFTVNPQEGDGKLIVKTASGALVAEIARGYGAAITDNNKFLVCKIKPLFSETRDARIKKKRPDDMPKDSMAIVELGTGKLSKVARVKSFKLADENATILAYLLEKALPESKPRARQDSAGRINAMVSMADSLMRVADSIRNKVNDARLKGLSVLNTPQNRAALPKAPEEPFEEGTKLVLRNLENGSEEVYMLVSEYLFNKKGTALVMETTRETGKPATKPVVIKLDLATRKATTVLTGFNDAKGYRMDEAGTQLAFVAERDSSAKSLQKFYKLYYHTDGADSAVALADRNTRGVPANWMVSDNAMSVGFSKSGKRLFFGTAPILPVRDTVTPDFERVSVDIWHHKDDYLQPVQLKNLQQELNRFHLARYDFNNKTVVQLGSPAYRNVMQSNEGDGDYFYAASDEGKRIATQWKGRSEVDVYAINPETGERSLIMKDLNGNFNVSPTGKMILAYDDAKRKYYSYETAAKKLTELAKDVKVPLYDVENDVPDDPNPYGVVGFTENDEDVLVYDQYDIWKLDPKGIKPSVNFTNGLGRTHQLTFRNIVLDREQRFISKGQKMLFSVFNNVDKGSGLKYHTYGTAFDWNAAAKLTHPMRVANAIKAKNADMISYSTETFVQTPDIRVINIGSLNDIATAASLYQPNPQQESYNWGTAELFKWKAYTGKITEGIVYKPEDFDPKKKYPMIAYFYERSSDGLYTYSAPAPTPSRLNIPFFVSRGYIVFVPDIWYTTGYPGKSAYDYIVSGTRALVAKGYIDSTKMGLQGQSWGGYQIAHLITRTNLYAAAWAGAPVANMTSAYGGIRWGTGLNRQFQYEKTQSRIGATLWEKQNLYLENSPLFHFPKVKTPVAIMHNDADGAVPWYQGIEMFTGLRRLGKPVWMLNYNNEDHNLVERRNRKDIQIREQQFFDHFLKGAKPAKWIAEGVPAVLKGRDWGFGY